jgi:hypothetical protein
MIPGVKDQSQLNRLMDSAVPLVGRYQPVYELLVLGDLCFERASCRPFAPFLVQVVTQLGELRLLQYELSHQIIEHQFQASQEGNPSNEPFAQAARVGAPHSRLCATLARTNTIDTHVQEWGSLINKLS